MGKITIGQIEQCYDFAKQNYDNKLTPSQESIEFFAEQIGMDDGSAKDYIRNFKHLLQGEPYRRTMSIEGTRYYLMRIYQDFGFFQFTEALWAVRGHILYYAMLENGAVQKGTCKVIDEVINYLNIGVLEVKVELWGKYEFNNKIGEHLEYLATKARHEDWQVDENNQAHGLGTGFIMDMYTGDISNPKITGKASKRAISKAPKENLKTLQQCASNL